MRIACLSTLDEPGQRACADRVSVQPSIATQPARRARIPERVDRQRVAGDLVPREDLEVLPAPLTAVVLAHERAARQQWAQRAARSADAVGAGDLVHGRARDRVEDRTQAVVAVPVEQPEAILALHRSDQRALAVSGADQRQSFDVGFETAVLALAGTGDAPPVALLRRIAGLGTVAPDRDVLLGNIEDPPLVVGDATFELLADVEGAHQFGVELAIRVRREPPLLDVTGLRGRKRVERAVSGTAIEATPVWLLAGEHWQHWTSGAQRAVGGIDPPRSQPHTGASHACHGNVERAASDLDAVAHVDVVRLQPRADAGPTVAVEAVDLEPVL